MVSFLPSYLLGILSLTLMTLNTLFWSIPVHIIALGKIAVPFSERWQRLCAVAAMKTVHAWIGGILFTLKLTTNVTWDVDGMEDLSLKEWYFINSNHQSWTDIMVLLQVFTGRIPFFKFFLKKELFWFPLMGTSFWTLDYPFMKRYSKEYLKKYPERKGKDLETTRKMCERYRHTPVSILNFIEGTRFTPEKQARQKSPYRYLLRPKAGGFALALSAMAGTIKTVLDVTIIYPKGRPTFWDFLGGKVSHIIVRVKKLPIPAHLLNGGGYLDDPAYRNTFQAWVGKLWQEKDELIAQVMTGTKNRTSAME